MRLKGDKEEHPLMPTEDSTWILIIPSPLLPRIFPNSPSPHSLYGFILPSTADVSASRGGPTLQVGKDLRTSLSMFAISLFAIDHLYLEPAQDRPRQAYAPLTLGEVPN